MSPRKQVNKNSRGPSSLRDGVCGDAEELDEEVKEILPEERPHSSFSSSQRRERVVKPKAREMTEEEMMDLALRLSEQEASMAAVKHQQEEDAMREALKESMFSQTQPCASPPSQSYHGNAEPSPKLPSRRKLAFPSAAAGRDAVPVEDLTAGPSAERAWRGAGNHNVNNNNNNNKRKRKREDGVLRLEGSDLPQTQKICSQDSQLLPLCSQDIPSAPTEPCQLPKTFTPPSTPSKPRVQLPRMNPAVLQTCRTAGFVLCSPQSQTSTQTGPPSPSKSPTFPGAATHSDNAGRSEGPTFLQSADCSDPDLEDVGETDPNLESSSSPVFGREESMTPSDDAGFAPNSPVFGRDVPARSSDCGAPAAAWDRGQRSPAPRGDKTERLKTSKLSHSKRRMYTDSNRLSQGPTCPQSPSGVQVSPGERPGGGADGLELSSVRAEHCRTSQLFGKSGPAMGETGPVFREGSPVFGPCSPPETGSGPCSPVFGRTSPLFGRTGTEKSTDSPQGSAPQKTNGLNHEEAESGPAPTAAPRGNAPFTQSYNHEEEEESGPAPTAAPRGNAPFTQSYNHEEEEESGPAPTAAPRGNAPFTQSYNHEEEEESGPAPTAAPRAGTEKQSRGAGESVPESGTLTSDMTLQWSDDEEDPRVAPSPVFPEERRLQRAEDQRTPPEHTAPALPGPPTHSPKRRGGPAPAPVAVEAACSDHTQPPPGRTPASHPEPPSGEPAVHYYWGVPFCPQGLDPDVYTQVILAQMEVYEKSLKQAQRGLLRKAEWGEAITPKTEDPLEDSPELIPTISLNRRALRSRRRPSEDRPPDEEEEEEGGGGQEAQTVDPVEEEEEEELDVVGCDVCPETQLSGDETQDLMMDTDAGAETQPDSPSLLPPQRLPRGEVGEGEEEVEEENHAENHAQELDKKEAEQEGDAGGASEPPAVMSPSREQEPPSGDEEPRREEAQEEAQEEEGALEVARERGEAAVSSVDCPICQNAFPAAQIEMHAAYCDGEQEVVECDEEDSPVAQRPSKRRALKSLATEERGDNSEPSGAAAKAPASQRREKCFVCHKLVPMAEFLRHTESCIQRRRAAANASPKGDLLSALETTDSRAPGGSSVPSVSRTSREVIDLSDDEEEEQEEENAEGGGSAFRVSDSPIRAFRSISEASDCLVDFRRQGAARAPAGQRARGRGRGGGVKRKFKRR